MKSKVSGVVFLSALLIGLAILVPRYTAAETNKTAGYAGSEACADCHEDQVKTYEHGMHGNKLNTKTPAAQQGCETCHGPLSKHVKSMGEDTASVPKVTQDKCLECHTEGKLALWQGSEHERREISCNKCHDAHGANKKMMLKVTQTETCEQCHKDVRNQILRTSHHPIREGKMDCSDCHNPHGTVADKLIAANTVNEKCYECHAEKRGPFLWEHAPVTEECTTCHTPHGSSYQTLLNSKTPFLCQKCHSEARHPGTLYGTDAANPSASVYSVLSNRGYYRNCLNCHSQIHGTNHPSGKSLSR